MEYYSALKGISNQTMKRHTELSVIKAGRIYVYHMILTTEVSRKGRPGTQKDGQFRRVGQIEHGGLLGQ